MQSFNQKLTIFNNKKTTKLHFYPLKSTLSLLTGDTKLNISILFYYSLRRTTTQRFVEFVNWRLLNSQTDGERRKRILFRPLGAQGLLALSLNVPLTCKYFLHFFTSMLSLFSSHQTPPTQPPGLFSSLNLSPAVFNSLAPSLSHRLTEDRGRMRSRRELRRRMGIIKKYGFTIILGQAIR